MSDETDAAAPEVHYPPSQRRRPRIIPSRFAQPHYNDRHKSVRLLNNSQGLQSKQLNLMMLGGYHCVHDNHLI